MHKVLMLMIAASVLIGCGFSQKWEPRGKKWATLTEPESTQLKQKFDEDKAVCVKEGYAYQTYSSYSGWGVNQYGGGGGGGGGSHFNWAVGNSCMEAKGWEKAGREPTFFGERLF